MVINEVPLIIFTYSPFISGYIYLEGVVFHPKPHNLGKIHTRCEFYLPNFPLLVEICISKDPLFWLLDLISWWTPK